MDSNSQTDRPLVTPLVRALTVTPSVLGVPYMFFIFIGMASSIVFLISRQLPSLLVCFPIYAIGRIMVARDPKIFEILGVKFTRCPPRYVGLWRAKSYKV